MIQFFQSTHSAKCLFFYSPFSSNHPIGLNLLCGMELNQFGPSSDDLCLPFCLILLLFLCPFPLPPPTPSPGGSTTITTTAGFPYSPASLILDDHLRVIAPAAAEEVAAVAAPRLPVAAPTLRTHHPRRGVILAGKHCFYTFSWCAKLLCRASVPKCHILMLLFNLSQALRKV